MPESTIPTYFTFKGKDSRDFGIVVINYPPPSVPAERASQLEIIGRSGALTQLEGSDVYKNLSLSVDCYINDLSRRSEIAAWIRGSGDLILGCNPSRAYKARITNQIDFSKVIRDNETRTFSLVFSCDPFQYEAEPENLLLFTMFELENPSSIASNPLLVVYGSGDITLNIGETSVSLTNVDGNVTIDSDAKVAYTSVGTNVAITLEDEVWPELAPGGNVINWSGSVSKLIVQPNWRWL